MLISIDTYLLLNVQRYRIHDYLFVDLKFAVDREVYRVLHLRLSSDEKRA